MDQLTRRQLALTASALVVAARPWRLQAATSDAAVGLVIGKKAAIEGLPGPGPDVPAGALRSQQSNISGSLRAGVESAVDDLNERGGALGRKFRLVVEELESSGPDRRRHAIEAARRLVAQPGLVAVIGHVDAEDALPASITYSEHGVLFITPTITLGNLNCHGLTNVFATVPDNAQIGQQTAIFVYQEGLTSMAVLRSRTDEAAEQALGFLDQAGSLGLTVAARTSYVSGRTDFREILADLRAKSFDTLFIAASTEESARIILQSRDLDITPKFVLGGLHDLPSLLARTRNFKGSIFVPVLEDASLDTKQQRDFIRHFRQRYGSDPDDWVWQGYDAINLLAATIEQTRSVEPQALIATLRYAMAWSGLMGRYSFERKGRIYTRSVAFARIRNGELSYFSLGG